MEIFEIFNKLKKKKEFKVDQQSQSHPGSC